MYQNRVVTRQPNYFPQFRRQVIPRPLIPNPFVPPVVIEERPIQQPIVSFSEEELIAKIIEKMRDDPFFQQKMFGATGANGVDGKDAVIDYPKLVLLIIAKIKEEKLIKNIKGDKGDHGLVTIIIKQNNKELYRLENVKPGSLIEVPVETYPKPKKKEVKNE